MKISAWLITIDETREYNSTSEDAPFIMKIEEVYLFDRNRRTHCAELQPSYDLRHLYTLITVAEGTSATKREELEENYAYGLGCDKYAHVSMVDRVIEEGDLDVIQQYPVDDGPLFKGATYDDRMYAIGEDCICNRIL